MIEPGSPGDWLQASLLAAALAGLAAATQRALRLEEVEQSTAHPEVSQPRVARPEHTGQRVPPR